MSAKPIRSQFFIAAGAALCGPSWKNQLARVLGPYHPDGARAQVDPRLVRRWAHGERPIPDWVMAALAGELRTRQGQCTQLVRDIDRLLREEAA